MEVLIILGLLTLGIVGLSALASWTENRAEKRTAGLETEIARIASEFTPDAPVAVPVYCADEPGQINRAVEKTINQYRERIRSLCYEIENVDYILSARLSCKDCADAETKLKYLTEHKDELQELKGKSDELRRRLKTVKTEESEWQAGEYREICRIMAEFAPAAPVSESMCAPVPYKVVPEMQCMDIVHAVSQYRQQMQSLCTAIAEIEWTISQILACEACEDAAAALKYLKERLPQLQGLKARNDGFRRQLETTKIHLLNEKPELMLKVIKAFAVLAGSRKCIGKDTDIKTFLPGEDPKELSMFRCGCVPVLLAIGEFRYALVSNAILVFDAAGRFATALDPSAMRIKIQKKEAQIYVFDGKPLAHDCVDEDSACVRPGTDIHTWLHTCRDGTPDLRYSYNPPRTYRVDVYEYTMITIAVDGKQVTFTVSSSEAAPAFEPVISRYIRPCGMLHDPIPELLELFRTLDGGADGTLDEIRARCSDKRISYFCRLSAS